MVTHSDRPGGHDTSAIPSAGRSGRVTGARSPRPKPRTRARAPCSKQARHPEQRNSACPPGAHPRAAHLDPGQPARTTRPAGAIRGDRHREHPRRGGRARGARGRRHSPRSQQTMQVHACYRGHRFGGILPRMVHCGRLPVMDARIGLIGALAGASIARAAQYVTRRPEVRERQDALLLRQCASSPPCPRITATASGRSGTRLPRGAGAARDLGAYRLAQARPRILRARRTSSRRLKRSARRAPALAGHGGSHRRMPTASRLPG